MNRPPLSGARSGGQVAARADGDSSGISYALAQQTLVYRRDSPAPESLALLRDSLPTFYPAYSNRCVTTRVFWVFARWSCSAIEQYVNVNGLFRPNLVRID